MHIGLVGGLGPSATAIYYERLVQTFRDAKEPLRLTIEHAEIDVLTKNAKVGDVFQQVKVFLGHIKALEAAGCDIVGITAITGHFCLSALRDVSPLPILSMTSLINSHCAAQKIKRVGLLGSPSVLKTHVYHQLCNVETFVPNRKNGDVGKIYMDVANSGCCTEFQAQVLINAGLDMVIDRGVEAVLLAGTDLALAFDGRDVGYPVIEALELHVFGFLNIARGDFALAS